MMLPLALEEGVPLRASDVVLRDAAGQRLDGQLIWLQRAATEASPSRQSWTSLPHGLIVLPAGDGETIQGDRALFLLIEAPDNGHGEMRLGDQRLRPVWRDLPEAASGDRGGRLSLVTSPARPDPTSPLEYWRWVVLAEQFGVEPPSVTEYGQAGALVAEHYANVWSIGLARLSEHSAEVGERVRTILTRICMDGQHAFAAWPADPAEVNRLLGLLLDFNRPIEDVVTDIRAWIRAQEMPLYWLEGATAEHVHLAVVNPASHSAVARFSWVANVTDQAAIPIAEQLPEGRVTRVRLERPADTDGRSLHVLQIQVNAWIEQVAIPDTGAVVRPPGLTLPPLQPALSLAGLRMEQAPQLRSDRATLVQIRKRADRWEVFFECLRPTRDTVVAAAGSSARPETLEQVRGREAVTLFVGADEHGVAPVQLVIPESGWHHLVRGSNDGTLQVHRRSYADRWLCRVVLPNAWLNALLEDDVTDIGVMRTHGDSDEVQYGPIAAPPWRMAPGRLTVNLTQWESLPDAAAQRR